MSFPQMAWKNPRALTNDDALEVMADFEASSFLFAASVWKPPTKNKANWPGDVQP